MLLGRVVAPGEPLFTPQDTDEALAWDTYLSSLCPGCGNPRDECMTRDGEDAYTATKVVCHACAATARAGRPDSFPQDTDGVYLSTRKDKEAD